MGGCNKRTGRGRIVVPNEIREKHGERYRIGELSDRVELIPLNDDPIEGFRDAIGDAFEDESIAEIERASREAE
ncbi:hypothetical protein [Haloterrigena turkmenica]|uniref:hypothetical protein n=1 Tax=Haloterrigena turkmenica TaxID=62320 RepID=UPI0009D79136|nr:hypothetical protein [Haloterrigena turkmenica]